VDVTPGRLNKREIDLYYPRLIIRDGEFCRLCGLMPKELSVDKLEIHEMKYERPLRIDNFCLLCHGCNNIEALNKENIEGGEPVPITYKTSRTVHPVFLEFISNKMVNALKDGLDYNALLADAILHTGMRKQTIQNWLYPLYAGYDSPYIQWGDRIYLKGREPRGRIQNLPQRNEELTDTEKQEGQ